MMKKILVFQAWPLTVLLMLVTISPATGATNTWKWEAGLQTELRKEGVMHMPTGLFVDAAEERYYVVDGGNNRILSFDRQGAFRSSFTAGNALSRPYDMIREPGFLWIVEKGRNTLTTIDLEKKKVTPVSLSENGRLLYPDRIAKDGDTFFVLDKMSGRIYLLDPSLKVKTSIGCQQCRSGFVDFKVKKGMIWALSQEDFAVQQFSGDGQLIRRVSLDREKNRFPRSLAVDDADNIYILDRHAGKVSVYDREGSYRYEFLEMGHARGQLYYPVELRFDPWGRLCIVDEGNGRVQIFSRK